MKKTIALLTVLTMLGSASVMAKPGPHNGGGFVGEQAVVGQCSISEDDCQPPKGGFKGPSMQKVTVEQVKNMKDDERVILRGYIVQALGDEDYLFQDDTGNIKVEIDHKRWRGQVITPKDLVEIHGKVDKSWKSMEIDVKRIFKVNPDGTMPPKNLDHKPMMHQNQK